MLKRFITAIEARLRKLPELFQIVRAEDVRSLLLGHCTLSYFDLQEILQIEQHAAASVDSPVIHGNCKVCGDLRTLSCWDSDVCGRACEECSGFSWKRRTSCWNMNWYTLQRLWLSGTRELGR